MCILDCTQSTSFCRGKFLKKLADDQFSSITKGSIFYNNVHTNFSHGSGSTRNLTFNGSIYYDLYLHILYFYFVGQSWV